MHRTQVGGLAAAEVAPRSASAVALLELVRDGHVSEALTAVDPLLAGVAGTDVPGGRVNGANRAGGAGGLGDELAALLIATALECRLARGDLEHALGVGERLAAYLRLPGRTGAVAHHATGELCAALNDAGTAAGHFASAGERLPGGAADARLVPWRVGAALAAVRLGRRPEAAALAHEQHALALGSPAATALALRTLAATESGGGREVLLRRALETIAPLRYGRLAAQVETDLAGLLTLGGGPGTGRAEAIALLRRAEAYAGGHELWPLQTRVRGLLDRVGEPPRRAPREILATLTAAERRITALAVEGLTNRAIAARLGITVKAVEWHLSHVYRKLGLRSRVELAAALAA